MKYHNILSLGILALLATFSLSAQQILEVKVPFSFRVGDTLMPAGGYIVDHSLKPDVLLVRSADLKYTAAVITQAVQGKGFPAGGKLVFNRYGENYFLSQVWRSGYSQGRRLIPTRAEREVALASRHAGTESASVSLGRR